MNTNAPLIRIELDAAAPSALRVQTIRLDVGEGEPQALSHEFDIAPGESVQVTLFCGATIVLSEPR